MNWPELSSHEPAIAASPLLLHMSHRQHIAPKRLVDPGPNQLDLDMILLSAATAPDHGRINPWKFRVVPKHQRQALGKAFSVALLERDPKATPEELDRADEKAFWSPCLIFAIVETAADGLGISETDRLISLGCAIQNMQLMATALSYGGGITSGKAVNSPPIRRLFNLETHQKGVCFLSFGTIESTKPPRPRPEPSNFFSSL
jgi:nitroreductase